MFSGVPSGPFSSDCEWISPARACWRSTTGTSVMLTTASMRVFLVGGRVLFFRAGHAARLAHPVDRHGLDGARRRAMLHERRVECLAGIVGQRGIPRGTNQKHIHKKRSRRE